MEKKTIVVVGAGKGMGNHIAKKFGENQFRVILIARNQESLRSYVEEFEKEEVECYDYVGNAAYAESLKETFSKILNKFGKIDVLVYNAAVLEGGVPTSLVTEEILHHYQVDVVHALLCTKLVLKEQEASGEGTILFTGGGLGQNPQSEYAALSMGKAALRALAYTLHQELSEKGIFVGIVTITGDVQASTHFDPEHVAEAYWELYTQRQDCEIVYE